MTTDEKKEFEKIDKLRYNGMKLAEKKCRKLKTGAIAWSLPYQHAKNTLRYTKLTISRKLGTKIGARLLTRLSKKCGHKIDHAVTAVGLGTDSHTGQSYFIVRNSWGASWGDQGYIKIAATEASLGKGICGIQQTSVVPQTD